LRLAQHPNPPRLLAAAIISALPWQNGPELSPFFSCRRIIHPTGDSGSRYFHKKIAYSAKE